MSTVLPGVPLVGFQTRQESQEPWWTQEAPWQTASEMCEQAMPNRQALGLSWHPSLLCLEAENGTTSRLQTCDIINIEKTKTLSGLQNNHVFWVYKQLGNWEKFEKTKAKSSSTSSLRITPTRFLFVPFRRLSSSSYSSLYTVALTTLYQ